MSKMILVFGLSAAGKTSFTREFAKRNNYLYFNPDDFYALYNGDECIHENEFDVWIALYRAIHMAELQHKDIVVDTDAPTCSHRSQFIDWFPSFEHHLIYIFTDEALRIKNNETRKRRIPDAQIKRQKERFKEFNAEEEEWKDGSWKTFSIIKNEDNKHYRLKILMHNQNGKEKI